MKMIGGTSVASAHPEREGQPDCVEAQEFHPPDNCLKVTGQSILSVVALSILPIHPHSRDHAVVFGVEPIPVDPFQVHIIAVIVKAPFSCTYMHYVTRCTGITKRKVSEELITSPSNCRPWLEKQANIGDPSSRCTKTLIYYGALPVCLSRLRWAWS